MSIQAVTVHSNTRIEFGFIKYFLVTPQYHHWHHSKDAKTHNKNFAVHFTFIDRLFGTHYLPEDEWPEEMGLKDEKFPKGYFKQTIYPFLKDPKVFSPRNPSTR